MISILISMALYCLKAVCMLCLSVFFFGPVVSKDQVTFMQQFCSEKQYGHGSLYQRNIKNLLTNLSYEAFTNKFYSSSVGQGVDKVYGLFLCNGGFTVQLCQYCISVAVGQVQQKCPNGVEAILFYGQCMLRYANYSIFSILDDSVYVNYDYGLSVYKQFDQQLSSELIDLSNKAISDNTSLQASATGMIYVSMNITVSAYVDCTPDLTPSDCNRCLQTGLDRLPMNGKQFGTTVQPSCQLQYLFIDFNPDAGKRFYASWIPLGAVAGVAGISFILNFYMHFRKSKARAKPTGLEDIESIENLHLQLNAIKVTTDNFSPENRIGRGGFGVVYMGILPDGQPIAVKRLTSPSGEGIKEFKTEASLAAKLQHKNLVKLYGFCLEGEEKLLVYEFLPNKSLDRFLFALDAKRGVELNWETRRKIILGIARGFLYLHEDSRFRVIHRDLKPSNILLDGEMNPKIADFGMAKLFDVDQTQGNTNRVAGTFGYMAPEYASSGNFSVKSDVFSFGVIILESVSGRRNYAYDLKEEDENLLNNVWELWNNGTALQLVDPNLGGNSFPELERFIHIGLLCVQEDAARRPTTASILSMLSCHSVILPFPTAPPSFLCRRDMSQQDLFGSNARFTEVFTSVHGRGEDHFEQKNEAIELVMTFSDDGRFMI